MELLKLAQLILFLLVSVLCLCWLITDMSFFNPIESLMFFIAGVGGIGLLGILVIEDWSQ